MERLLPPLREGATLHLFRSGGGLRVALLNNGSDLIGYGEAPNIEEALEYCGEDYEAGGRPYKEVYGPIHPHYLTGSAEASCNGDRWLLRGTDVDISWVDGKVQATITPSVDAGPNWELTKDVVEDGIPRFYEDDCGYIFRASTSRFPSGEPCLWTQCVHKPEGAEGIDHLRREMPYSVQGDQICEVIERLPSTREFSFPFKVWKEGEEAISTRVQLLMRCP